MVSKKPMYVFSNISFEIFLNIDYSIEELDNAIKESLAHHFEEIKVIEYDMKKKIKDIERYINCNKSKMNIEEVEESMESKGFDVWQDNSGNIELTNTNTTGFQIQCTKPRIKFYKKDGKNYADILLHLFHYAYANNCKAGYMKITSDVFFDIAKQTKATNQEIEIEIKEGYIAKPQIKKTKVGKDLFVNIIPKNIKKELVYGLKNKDGKYVETRIGY